MAFHWRKSTKCGIVSIVYLLLLLLLFFPKKYKQIEIYYQNGFAGNNYYFYN